MKIKFEPLSQDPINNALVARGTSRSQEVTL